MNIQKKNRSVPAPSQSPDDGAMSNRTKKPSNQPDDSHANGDCRPASCSADDLANGLRHAADDHPCCQSTLIASADMIDRLHQGIREFWSLAQFDWDTMPEPSRRKFREVVEEMADELLEPN